MATETLGRRIMCAAEAYNMAAWVARGRTTFPQEANARANAALADLRALCARAEAAERLAVAVVRRVDAREAWVNGADVGAISEAFVAFEKAATEYDLADIAWRALGEVQP